MSATRSGFSLADAAETISFRSRRALPQNATASTRATAPASQAIDGPDRTIAKYAAAALTAATSADNPKTPTTLANCATGSTVVWLYPSRTQGNPLQKYVRASS